MGVKEGSKNAALLEENKKPLEKKSSSGADKNTAKETKETRVEEKRDIKEGARGPEEKKRRNSRRQPAKRFAKDRANTVGREQGRRYLLLALAGLFLPPLAPVAWLLTHSLRLFARTHGFLLDNRVYAAWVLGLTSTIFYSLLFLLVLFQYIFVPGYSLL